MKNLNTVSRISFTLGLALLATPALSAPGKGWDAFNIGQGDDIHAAGAYMGTSLGGSAGKGYDVFRTGGGDPIPDTGKGYLGTSQGGGAGQGWDVFNVGAGDRL